MESVRVELEKHEYQPLLIGEILEQWQQTPSPQKLKTSPMKFRFMPKRGVGLSLNPTFVLLAQERIEETPIAQANVGSPSVATEDPEIGAGQEDPEIPILVGTKTRPSIQFATKQGPTSQILASMKRPTKTPTKGSSSK